MSKKLLFTLYDSLSKLLSTRFQFLFLESAFLFDQMSQDKIIRWSNEHNEYWK